MEHVRLLIAIALSFLVFFVWQLFFVDQQAIQPQPQQTATATPDGGNSAIQPQAPPSPVVAATQVEPAQPSRNARVIKIDTPLYTVSISENGAVFDSFVLKDYRKTVNPDSPQFQMIGDTVGGKNLKLSMNANSIEGLNQAVFTTSVDRDQISLTDQPRQVVFSWRNAAGIQVDKIFTFDPTTYLIQMAVRLSNGSAAAINDQLIVALAHQEQAGKKRVYGFEGPSALINGKLEQINVKDLDEKNIYTGKINWLAIQTRYFMSAIMPESQSDASIRLNLSTSDDVLSNDYVSDNISVAGGALSEMKFHLFFGPKSMHILSAMPNQLEKAVNFGMFDILAKPCLWLMNFIYGFIPNYGIAIILLTILIKLIFWPLGNKSYKSMSEMKKLQPLIKELKDKYGSDKRKMNEETMKLYRTYKVNPMGGCLPMVVQIPVFFALYRMLYEAIELRHAPFFGWINDLSAPDRLFHFSFSIPMMEPPYGIPVLTIVMGATMFLQQKMSPPMGDATQAKMMMFMPIIFTVIFINFSSGLVLYWLINNILSISQQYYVQQKTA